MFACSGLFLALTARSRRCGDPVCFLRVFCRVDNVVGRRTLDPELTSASVKLSALPQLMEYEVLIQLRLPHSMDSCVHDSFFGRFQRGKLFDDLTLPRNKDPIR